MWSSVWCDVVWYGVGGVVWVVWYGVVWCNVVWYGVVCTVQFVWCSVMKWVRGVVRVVWFGAEWSSVGGVAHSCLILNTGEQKTKKKD